MHGLEEKSHDELMSLLEDKKENIMQLQEDGLYQRVEGLQADIEDIRREMRERAEARINRDRLDGREIPDDVDIANPDEVPGQ